MEDNGKRECRNNQSDKQQGLWLRRIAVGFLVVWFVWSLLLLFSFKAEEDRLVHWLIVEQLNLAEREKEIDKLKRELEELKQKE